MNQSTKNFKVKRIRLKLLLLAHKAYRRAEKLQDQIKYWRMVYPVISSFTISEFYMNMLKYIENLEKEATEEMEFFEHVFRNYCTDQDADGQIGEVSPINSAWH